MQALIITAYKNTEQLIKLIELVSEVSENFRIFLHIDRKSNINIELKTQCPTVRVIDEYSYNFRAGYACKEYC